MRRAKPSKYRNVCTTVDNYTFASKREAKRYGELKLRLMAQSISVLQLQPRYQLIVKGVKIGTYVADFRYLERDGTEIVEDVKGVRTSTYRLKANLMKALYGITIKET